MKFIDEEKYKNFFGIYIIKNLINNKVYIGQTRQKFQKRYWHHSWKLKENSHDNKYLQASYNKYGKENFVFYIEKIVEKVEELNETEIRIISKYRKLGLSYNIQNGGQDTGGWKMTKEHKKLIGEKNRVNMTGKKHSEETKRKMSESRTGKHYNKSNYTINENQAFEIKSLLIKGLKPSYISKKLNINYKVINGILSTNSWSGVKVEGWEEFKNNRKTYKRLSEKDYEKIYKMYKENNIPITEIANLYGKTRGAISIGIKKFEEKIKK